MTSTALRRVHARLGSASHSVPAPLQHQTRSNRFIACVPRLYSLIVIRCPDPPFDEPVPCFSRTSPAPPLGRGSIAAIVAVPPWLPILGSATRRSDGEHRRRFDSSSLERAVAAASLGVVSAEQRALQLSPHRLAGPGRRCERPAGARLDRVVVCREPRLRGFRTTPTPAARACCASHEQRSFASPRP